MAKSNRRRLGTASLVLAAATAMAATAIAMPSFGDWSEPATVEDAESSSDALNTTFVDGCASLSPDGLTLAFTSNRTGDFDVYFAERRDTSSGFGNPVRLPAPINGPSTDSCPTLLQGKRMIFTSFRDDPAGDLYETRRGPNGWSAPSRFGPNVNAPGIQDEVAAVYQDDEGREVMIWSRRNGANPGDIFESIDGGPATLVQGGVNSSAADNRPTVTHDGRTIFWDSTRGGGAPDIWSASRSSTSQDFGDAVHRYDLSSTGTDMRPSISWDGTMITFSSNRTGSESMFPDMWFAVRRKATGN